MYTMQESTISIEHFRFIMKSLPVGVWKNRRGQKVFIEDFYVNILFPEMNTVVDEMLAAVDDGDGVINYQEFLRMMKKQ